ncbi:F-box domain [Arabidopsis thaliana x Arabidopsis arenosa]|uniref:F-box domain n=1 Tax=Arabidopsis thaliana x Arabidopsis arenosa TaxID=1240361 RepID=A0A8T1ZSC8_9BRAS|nr:F-box domain [Arabidopsis thaliana x Arabidopsis arenosa]
MTTRSSSPSSPLLSSPSSTPPPISSNARGKLLWTGASSKAKGKRIQYPVDNVDRISMLPDELLQKILSTLSTKDAVKTSTLSKRWVDQWKWRPHLSVGMRNISRTNPTSRLRELSLRVAESMTRTIDNHRGRLESCTISHFLFQCKDGTLDRWVQTVTHEKQTKELTLINYIGCMGPFGGYNRLYLSPSTFSHPSLTSLSLTRYKLTETAFKNCSNLKTLKLFDIMSDVSVLSIVFKACSSLEVLVLQITCLNLGCVLKIENKNLQVLQVTCPTLINKMEVNAPRLEILDIKYIYCDSFLLDAPKIMFNRDYWFGAISVPHISYHISSLAQEKKRIWFELLVSQFFNMKRYGSLSVSVDVRNPNELEILKEVLLLWNEEMKNLEIIFKNNNAPREESESSINGGARNKWLDGEKPFPDAFLRIRTVWMYNFDGSNEEEFALASRFVTQGTVIDKLMIETSTYPPVKQLMTEAKVAKLMELPKGNDYFTIECF